MKGIHLYIRVDGRRKMNGTKESPKKCNLKTLAIAERFLLFLLLFLSPSLNLSLSTSVSLLLAASRFLDRFRRKEKLLFEFEVVIFFYSGQLVSSSSFFLEQVVLRSSKNLLFIFISFISYTYFNFCYMKETHLTSIKNDKCVIVERIFKSYYQIKNEYIY